MADELIERLARLRGIGDAYNDYRGQLQPFGVDAQAGILRAMGVAVDDHGALAAAITRLEIAKSRALLPRVAAAQGVRIGVDINVTAVDYGANLKWSLALEDGGRHEGVLSTNDCPELWRGEVAGCWITRRRFELPPELPPGYHMLEASLAGRAPHRCLIVTSPRFCHEPAAVAAGRRIWGVAVQLYALRSAANWGIGDFSDLQALVRWLGPRGAGYIGLNPLHALAPADPGRASPYSASDRHFLNVLYIAVPAVAEYAECAAAQRRLRDPAVQARIAALRAAVLVDYPGVARLKFEVLELLHQEFRRRHLAGGTERAAKYRGFAASGGPALQRYACFDALDRYFRATRDSASGWLNWPEEFRDSDGPAVARFAAAHAEDIEFFVYLQWLAHEQLSDAQTLARTVGMPIGLYGDYAVGAHPSGAETWADPASYRLGAEIGAPPDPLALKGQGWGIAPQDPLAIEEQRLQGFVHLIRDNMRHYGALRLDHVMSLFRLWWVPAGASPSQGAYVHYPLHWLLTVLTLESARAECLVVGEDLGVVPDEMRAAMGQYGLYQYKVMLFEKRGGRFRGPDEYPRRALATATTHDMPTLRSYWDGRDIVLRERLNLYPNAAVRADVLREREHDRTALLEALAAQGLAPVSPRGAADPFTPALADALHLYLARSNAVLVAVQLEDLVGSVDPVNLPGTNHEYPNWQRKIDADIEDIAARADVAQSLAAIAQARA